MKLSDIFNFRVFAGTVIVFAGLTCTFIGWVWWTQPSAPSPYSPAQAEVTLIPAPTATVPPPPTSTPGPDDTPVPDTSGIFIGGYVQISGTNGEGLRLRSAPGLSSEQRFLGYDSEVYMVKDGPQTVDGFVWWYLVAPYDENRAGWAAANYLSAIPAP